MLINNPEQVKNANCLMMGIDFIGRALDWCTTADDCKGLDKKFKAIFINPFRGGFATLAYPNEDAWCDFRYVKGLENADRMIEYTPGNVKMINFYIDIARRIGGGNWQDIETSRRVLKGIVSPEKILRSSEEERIQRPEDICPII